MYASHYRENPQLLCLIYVHAVILVLHHLENNFEINSKWAVFEYNLFTYLTSITKSFTYSNLLFFYLIEKVKYD